MKHAAVNEVRIVGARCLTQDILHDYLARKLDFPEYYGKNLSALADCLAEEDRPTLITFKVDEDEIEDTVIDEEAIGE